MTYGHGDARSALTVDSRPVERCGEPQFVEFGRLRPEEVSPIGSRNWSVRAQNFVLVYNSARAGDVLRRASQPDEYVVLLPSDGSVLEICAGDQRVRCDSAGVAVVPPGDTSVVAVSDAELIRLFSCRSPDLVERAGNAATYAEPDPNVTPFAPWPEPPGGYRIRVYPARRHPYADDRFGRIVRCTTFMVNFFDPDNGPRDPGRLSPHTHPDFEQCSLVVDGEYVHHLRTPWTASLVDWRDDVHHLCGSPSVAIIPPGMVHTSQSVGQARNQLIDIFCPPRLDFSERPGWVINAEEYPMPGGG